jgi:Protein of unknown function (DUF2510)
VPKRRGLWTRRPDRMCLTESAEDNRRHLGTILGTYSLLGCAGPVRKGFQRRPRPINMMAVQHDLGSAAVPRAATQAARWYPDPTGRFQFRYWDGTAWTAHVATQGAGSVDTEPLPPALPGPAVWGSPAGSPQRLHRRRRRRLLLLLVIPGVVAIVLAVAAIANRTVFTDRLLSADFGNGSDPFMTGTTSGYDFDVVDGTYRIQSRIADPGPAEGVANFARTGYAVDVSAEVESVTGEGAFGVGCYHSPNAGYALLASPQDGVALVRRDAESAANDRVIVTTSGWRCRRPVCNCAYRVPTAWSGPRFR